MAFHNCTFGRVSGSPLSAQTSVRFVSQTWRLSTTIVCGTSEYNVLENLLHCLALGTKIRADKYFWNSYVLFLTTGDAGSLKRSRASADTLVSSCRSLCLAASSIKHQQNCNMYSQAPGNCSTWCEKCSVGEVSRLKTFVLQSNFFQGNRFSFEKACKML